MDVRWIIVRERQAGLLAEAEGERLARLVRVVREARQSEPSSGPDVRQAADPAGVLRASPRSNVGYRPGVLGAAPAARAGVRHVARERSCSAETC